MNILVLNVGSSSLKFQLLDTDADRMKENSDRKLAGGHIERIGGEAVWSFRAEARERPGETVELRYGGPLYPAASASRRKTPPPSPALPAPSRGEPSAPHACTRDSTL